MNTRPLFAALAALPLLATGCAGSMGEDGAFSEDSLITDQVEHDKAALISNVDGMAAIEAPSWTPKVTTLTALPSRLGLEGGTVTVEWASRDAVGCAVLADNETIAMGLRGTLQLDVEADTNLRLVCLDEDQEVVADEQAPIDVFEAPIDTYEPDAQEDLAVWETAELSGHLNPHQVYEVSFNLADDLRVIAWAQSEGDSPVELWLAQDADEDGLLSPDEVIAWTPGVSEDALDTQLDAGDYSLFVIAGDVALDWNVDLAVTGPEQNGNQ